MEDYVETFREEHVWNTNWKILAENFMESYHLPTLHRATSGRHRRWRRWTARRASTRSTITGSPRTPRSPIGNAHPDNTALEGDWRKTMALLSIYPTQLISLTPGYFWYLILSPRGVGRVHIVFGGGLVPEFIRDPQRRRNTSRRSRRCWTRSTPKTAGAWRQCSAAFRPRWRSPGT